LVQRNKKQNNYLHWLWKGMESAMAKIGVIGAGSWGIALAKVLHTNGHQVVVWSIVESEVEMLREKHEHVEKLPGVKLPEDMEFTTDMETAVLDKEYLILAVPSVFTRSTARSMAPFVKAGQVVVCVAKGIEENTLMTISDVVAQEIPAAEVAVMCGPSHAEEVGIGLPTAVVAGASKQKIAEGVQDIFMNEVFRVYTSPDVLGMELGGSLKNVIALAAGMADGLGYGDNTKAALITRGISEISRLALKMGANAETLGGLTGIGDLIVTCESKHSRNRKAGMLMGQGYTMQQATDEVKMVVEGVYSAKAAIGLAHKYGVSMPIIEEVNKVLFEDKPARDAVTELMMRDRKSEHSTLEWKA
jgi:glycerol-3-phosphate dehydrogenase (NAD(P)+)